MGAASQSSKARAASAKLDQGAGWLPCWPPHQPSLQAALLPCPAQPKPVCERGRLSRSHPGRGLVTPPCLHAGFAASPASSPEGVPTCGEKPSSFLQTLGCKQPARWGEQASLSAKHPLSQSAVRARALPAAIMLSPCKHSKCHGQGLTHHHIQPEAALCQQQAPASCQQQAPASS